jgi:hypothetical protein
MIELTVHQQEAVASQKEIPPRVLDPTTNIKYVLVRAEVYDRVREMVDLGEGDQFVRDMTPHVMEVFGRAGWDDPAMDIYNDLDRAGCGVRYHSRTIAAFSNNGLDSRFHCRGTHKGHYWSRRTGSVHQAQ